jgi:hypothetical protein
MKFRPKKKKRVSGQRAHQSRPVRIKNCFLFNLFFSDAPCDPSTPSSEYTWYHRLQNVLASGISLSKKNTKKTNRMAASVLEEQLDQKHIFFFLPCPFFKVCRTRLGTMPIVKKFGFSSIMSVRILSFNAIHSVIKKMFHKCPVAANFSLPKKLDLRKTKLSRSAQ